MRYGKCGTSKGENSITAFIKVASGNNRGGLALSPCSLCQRSASRQTINRKGRVYPS